MRRIPGCSTVAFATLLFASCDEVAGPSSIVTSVAIVPGVFSLLVGDSQSLTTIARGKVGNPVVGRPVTWVSLHSTVASVSSTGMVTGVGVGSALITATVDGYIDTAAVTVSPKVPITAFESVATGLAHSCGLAPGGAIYCWGRGESGQLGSSPPVTICLSDQSLPCILVPVPIDGGILFQQVTAGNTHTCGLTSDGSAYCWGSNDNGQLGDNSRTSRNAPNAVATALKFTSIDAGSEHTCALTGDGKAYCWGNNYRGEIGDGTTTTRLVPAAVSAPSGVTFRLITAGGGMGVSCAIATTGEAYCWGANSTGELGQGTADLASHTVPAPVAGGHKFVDLSVGLLAYHVCGLDEAGAAYCWGQNGSGNLGDGSTRQSRVPVAVSGGHSFKQLVAGGSLDFTHTCGLTSSGTAYCWGDNDVGALGDGSTQDRPTPTEVAGGHTFASINAGARHTCGVTTTGTVYCWGSGRAGQLGTNATTISLVPAKVVGQR